MKKFIAQRIIVKAYFHKSRKIEQEDKIEKARTCQ